MTRYVPHFLRAKPYIPARVFVARTTSNSACAASYALRATSALFDTAWWPVFCAAFALVHRRLSESSLFLTNQTLRRLPTEQVGANPCKEERVLRAEALGVFADVILIWFPLPRMKGSCVQQVWSVARRCSEPSTSASTAIQKTDRIGRMPRDNLQFRDKSIKRCYTLNQHPPCSSRIS